MSLRDKQRVIYTTPIKALSNQKYRELQEEFADALKISSLPAVVALNHRKKYYSIFTGALPLEPDHVHKFVFDQLSGGVRLVRLDPNLNISSLISTKQFGTDEEVWETLKSQASGQEL